MIQLCYYSIKGDKNGYYTGKIKNSNRKLRFVL